MDLLTEVSLEDARRALEGPGGAGREVSRNIKKWFVAPSSPFIACQPLRGSNLVEPHSLMGGSTAGSRLPCLHRLSRAGSEAAFTALVVASAGLGLKPPSLPL